MHCSIKCMQYSMYSNLVHEIYAEGAQNQPIIICKFIYHLHKHCLHKFNMN